MFHEFAVHQSSLNYILNEDIPIFYRFMFEHIKYLRPNVLLSIIILNWSFNKKSKLKQYICKYVQWFKHHTYIMPNATELLSVYNRCNTTDIIDVEVKESLALSKIFVDNIEPQLCLLRDYFGILKDQSHEYSTKVLKMLDFLCSIAIPNKQNARELVSFADDWLYRLSIEHVEKVKTFVLKTNDALAMLRYYLNIKRDQDVYKKCKNIPITDLIDNMDPYYLYDVAR